MAELDWLGIVRHGESTGNVAAAAAETGRLERIDIPQRDADVPLSDTGREQAAAVGRWLAGLPEPPDVVVASPYLRAVQTAEIALETSGLAPHRDERLRDRELGVLDLLTTHGVSTLLPDEAARRDRLTVSEWVRQTLREARRRQPGRDAGRKLQAIRAAASHAFPTTDIDQMLAEIERGYLGGADRR